MCGIVGAVGQRTITGILIEGLKRLEYRGYDSAGVAVINATGKLGIVKTAGKVSALEAAVSSQSTSGSLGIAHTRWATHGAASEVNAHPHLSCEMVALVHNGIIENYQQLKETLVSDGYVFMSETDSEAVAHLIHREWLSSGDFTSAVKSATAFLEGAFAIAVVHREFPDRIVVARKGSPLVIGVGIGENFIASDHSALGQVTDRFIFLKEGDIGEIRTDTIAIWNDDKEVDRKIERIAQEEEAGKGKFRHYMQKEIFEQAHAIEKTLLGRMSGTEVFDTAFGKEAAAIFERVKRVQIVACGTSYHAGLVAKHWIESLARLPCSVDIASEFRYGRVLVQDDCLFVSVSQSGETADTLAAHRFAKEAGYIARLAICNVPNSSLVREAELAILTVAGREIGVASTKAFTTQLATLALLAIVLARRNGLTELEESRLVNELRRVPELITETLKLDMPIRQLARDLADKHDALFLGRGVHYAIAKEGSLKLKEISYIHAEAYPAGELKHGPLAIVDENMPVVAIAPSGDLLEKLKSNLQEVSARNGKLYVFADKKSGFEQDFNVTFVCLPECSEFIAPLLYTIPLQLLAYHVAVIKGTDVDQPRNLAKSVTVE